MSISQYDDAIESMQKTGDLPNAGTSPVDAAIEQNKLDTKSSMQQSMFVASKTTPDRAARVANIAKEISLSPRLVNNQLDTLEQTKSRYLDYDKIIEENPTVAQFLSNPDNASVAHQDVESLKKIDVAGRLIRPKAATPGFVDEIDRAAESGFNNLGSSSLALAIAFGYGDRATIEKQADYNMRAQKLDELRPDYSKEFNDAMSKEGNDVNAAFKRMRESYRQYQDGNILGALKTFGQEGGATIYEVLDMAAKALAQHPKGLAYSVVENLPNSLPAMGLGAGGLVAGPVGVIGGSFMGGAITEIGSEINSELSQRGVDVTNPDALEAAYKDPTFMKDVRDRAARKGITTAGVDAVFAMFAGGKLAKAKGGIKHAAKEAGKELIQETSGEILGEFGGQVAREQGNFDKVDLGSSVFEGITALGQSAGQIGAGASFRTALNANPVKAVKEVSQQAGSAISTLQKLSGIKDISDAVHETKNLKSVPSMVSDLVDMSTGGKGAANVYFQVDDHDSYWSKKGVPPAKAAEDILGDGGKAYADAKATGGVIEVPVSTFVEKMVSGGQSVEDVLSIARTEPGGMTLKEASDTLKNVGVTMQDLANEVSGNVQNQIEEEARSPKTIKENIRKQLVDAGMSNDRAVSQAELIDSFFSTMGERSGVNPQDLFNKYNLKVSQAQQAEAGALNQQNSNENSRLQRARDMGFNTDKTYYHGTRSDINSFDSNKITQGNAFFFTEDKSFANMYGEGDRGNVIPVYLKLTNTFDPRNQEHVAAIEPFVEEKYRNSLDVLNSEWINMESNAITDAIKKAGFDSYIVEEQGRTNVAVFSPDQIRSINAKFKEKYSKNILSQGGDQNPLGQFFMKDGQANINLLENANPSTFLHETGHFFLEVFGDIAESESASEQIKQDYNNLLKYLGVDDRSQIGMDQHEKFAEGFESYLMMGEAPSQSLKRAFNKFKVWLTSVYRSLTNRGVRFTPEVKDIMDRLIATDEEISNVIESNNMDIMSEMMPSVVDQKNNDVMSGVDVKSFGLSEKQAEKFSQARDEASRVANEELRKKVMKRIMQEKTAQFKEAKKSVTEQVSKEADGLKIYNVIDTLKLGMLNDGKPNRDGASVGVKKIKLDRKGIDTKDIPRGILANKKDVGFSADEIAGIFGYNSGAELIDDLKNSMPKKDYIYQEVDKKMHEQFPDLMREYLINPEIVEEAAQEAIHNEMSAKLKRMEFELIAENIPVLKQGIRQITKMLPSDSKLKDQAASVVSKSTYQNNRPYQYRNAEKKFARMAGEAFARGDFDKALEYKRKEIYNFELYKSSIEANHVVEKSLNKFEPILKKKDDAVSKTRDIHLVNAARAILAAFNIGKMDKAPGDYLQQLKSYDEDAFETISAIVDGAIKNAKSYDQVSIEQFNEMADAVLAVWDLAKSSREIEIAGSKMNIDQVRSELIGKLGDISNITTGGEHRTKGEWDKIKTGLIGVKAAMARAESMFSAMDGSENKVFQNYIFRPIKDALTTYRLENGKAKKHFKELLVPIEKTLHNGEIKANELVDARGRTFIFRSKAQLLGAMLHIGNLSNKTKLLVGRGWGSVDDAGNLNSAKWDSFINRMIEQGILTKADFDFLQGVWDMNEAYKPHAQKTHKQLNGFYFNEVTADSFKNKFGEYRGGYVPAVADMNESQDARKFDEKSISVGVDNSFMFPSAPKGFTKSRVENYATPLSIDLEMVPAHLDKVIKYIYVEPAIKAAARVVINKDFQGALSHYDETMFESMLMPWMQRAAQQVVMTPLKGQAGKFIDTFLRGLRNRVAQQAMFMNVVNTLQQPVGLSVAAVKVEGKYLRNSLWRYVKGPSALASDVANASPFMRVKLEDQLNEVNSGIKDILIDGNKYTKAKEFGKKNTYVLQSATQNFVDVVAWAGAYDQFLAKGLSHDEAVQEADSVIRQTQGGMDAEDVSRIETGNSFYRLFNMFSGYFNTQANLLGSEYAQIMRELGLRKGAGRGLYVYTFGFMLPAVLSQAIVQAFRGEIDEDDDDEYMDDVMGLFFMSQFKYATAMFPYGGNVINSAVNRWNTSVYDDSITTSPAIAMIENTVAAPKSVYDTIVSGKNEKKAIRDSLTAIGLLSGLPAYALYRPLGYLSDVNEGKADPKNPVDFARGVVSGNRGSK